MLSLPNLLTLSRILAVPILLFLLWPGVAEGSLQPKPIDYALAFGLYCLMGITDYFDGYVARARGIVSRLGAFLDPIADKIMIAAVILLLVFTRDIDGYHVIAALMILLREIIVSGLREFLGSDAAHLRVTKLAKWKTTAQMVAIAVLFLGTGLEYLNGVAMQGMTPTEFAEAVTAGLADPIRACGNRDCASYANLVGIWLLWLAALLTAVTGWEYFAKSLPHLRDEK